MVVSTSLRERRASAKKLLNFVARATVTFFEKCLNTLLNAFKTCATNAWGRLHVRAAGLIWKSHFFVFFWRFVEKYIQPTCVCLLSRIGNSRSVAGSDDFLKIWKWCQKEGPRGPGGAAVREVARLAPRGSFPNRGARQESITFLARSPIPT